MAVRSKRSAVYLWETVKKPKPSLPPLGIPIRAENLIRDVSAILTALLHGRDTCSVRLHVTLGRDRKPTFTLVVDDNV